MNELAKQEQTLIHDSLKRFVKDVDTIMEHTLGMVTTLSQYMGVITERLGTSLHTNAPRHKAKLERLHYSGLSKLLEQPGSSEDLQPFRSLISVFENKDEACEAMDHEVASSNDVIVRIGEENDCPGLKNYSVVAKKFLYDGEPIGTIGVVGPKRMRYSHVVAAVENITDQLDELLSSL